MLRCAIWAIWAAQVCISTIDEPCALAVELNSQLSGGSGGCRRVAIDAGAGLALGVCNYSKKNMHLGGCTWDPRGIVRGDVRGMSMDVTRDVRGICFSSRVRCA